jgi:hypothetical protein
MSILSPLGHQTAILKYIILSILIGSIFFLACSKENFKPAEACLSQAKDPSGRSYTCSSITSLSYNRSHCGLLPLNRSNYWIYLDSIFTNSVFEKIQYDTLRYTNMYQSLTDSIVWWESNIEIGLPRLLFANDSSVFGLSNRFFSAECIKDVKKEYSLFPGDSLKYLASFGDNAAQGRSVKLNNELATSAGVFSDCILFEKTAPHFRKEQVFFKPGTGVIKYTNSEAEMGSPLVKLKRIATLVEVHIQ